MDVYLVRTRWRDNYKSQLRGFLTMSISFLCLVHSVIAQTKSSAPAAVLLQNIPFPVTGSTEAAVNSNIENLIASLGEEYANISPFKKSAAEPRYLAIGGSLTAGLRNGGLYREGQLTAYPNFIAHQMGLRDFRLPLFNQSQGNGSGYKKMSYDGKRLQYLNITNALAITSLSPLTFTAFTGRVDNLGMPGMGLLGSVLHEQWRIDNNVAFALPYEPSYRSYFRRLLPDDDQQWLTTYLAYISKQESDISTIELGLDDAIWYATQGGYRLGGLLANIGSYDSNPIKLLLSQFNKTQTKVIVATVPDVLKLPYFNQYQVASIRKAKSIDKLYAVRDDRYDYLNQDPTFVGTIGDNDILLPTANVVSLFDGSSQIGLSQNNPLTSLDVLNQEEQHGLLRIDELNEIISLEAKRYNVPVVDLKALYKSILSGSYITDDGVKIDSSFPNGNFFSSDGLTPTVLGQAVIANEWIKTINQAYKAQIPLIRTKQIVTKF